MARRHLLIMCLLVLPFTGGSEGGGLPEPEVQGVWTILAARIGLGGGNQVVAFANRCTYYDWGIDPEQILPHVVSVPARNSDLPVEGFSSLLSAPLAHQGSFEEEQHTPEPATSGPQESPSLRVDVTRLRLQEGSIVGPFDLWQSTLSITAEGRISDARYLDAWFAHCDLSKMAPFWISRLDPAAPDRLSALALVLEWLLWLPQTKENVSSISSNVRRCRDGLCAPLIRDVEAAGAVWAARNSPDVGSERIR